MQTNQLVSEPAGHLQKANLPNPVSSAQSLSLQEILNRFSQRALLETEIVALYQSAAVTIKEALQVPFCRIWQVTSDGYRLRQVAGDENPEVSQSVVLPTAEKVESSQQAIFQPKGICLFRLLQRALVGVITQIPGQKRSIGCIEVHAFEAYEFDLDTIHFLQTVGHILANATERHRLEALTSTQSQILEKVAAETDVTEVFNLLCLLLEKQLPDAYCSILILDPATRQLGGGAAPTMPIEYAKVSMACLWVSSPVPAVRQFIGEKLSL